MGLFGRETQRDRLRIEAMQQWVRARTPLAPLGAGAGVLSILDFFTPIGVVLGLTAVVMGVRGLGQIQRQPHLLGRRLCRTAIVLGCIGLVLSIGFIFWAY
jgi:hypothetical protein